MDGGDASMKMDERQKIVWSSKKGATSATVFVLCVALSSKITLFFSFSIDVSGG